VKFLEENGKSGIVLAGRPYHIAPELNPGLPAQPAITTARTTTQTAAMYFMSRSLFLISTGGNHSAFRHTLHPEKAVVKARTPFFANSAPPPRRGTKPSVFEPFPV